VLQKPFADHALFAAIERGLASSHRTSNPNELPKSN
jgi:hypothetical protein